MMIIYYNNDNDNDNHRKNDNNNNYDRIHSFDTPYELYWFL